MAQQPQRTRPFVADPTEWEVVEDDYEVVEDTPAKPAATWSDRLGLNAPVPSMPAAGSLEPMAAASLGLLRGVGSGAVDLAQGAVSSLMGTANAMAGVEDRGAATAAAMAGKSYQPAPLREMPAPDTMSGTVGTLLPDVAMSAMPVGEGIAAAKGALPSAARAGEKFQAVMGAAKDVPVAVEAAGKHALRILELRERGGMLPKAVNDFLKRVTDPKKGPMAYGESRDFASNLGKLSVDEMNRLKPVVKREVAQMAAELNKANAEAARAAGKGAEYKSAMREYANAMRMKDAIDATLKKAKQAALPAAGLGGAAYWLGRE